MTRQIKPRFRNIFRPREVIIKKGLYIFYIFIIAVNEQTYSGDPWDVANEPSHTWSWVGALGFSGVVSLFLLTVISPGVDSCRNGEKGGLVKVSAAPVLLGTIQNTSQGFPKQGFHNILQRLASY